MVIDHGGSCREGERPRRCAPGIATAGQRHVVGWMGLGQSSQSAPRGGRAAVSPREKFDRSIGGPDILKRHPGA